MTSAAVPHPPRSIPPTRLGTWFFIAADIMFFTGLIAAYFVIRSPDPDLFNKSAQSLNRISALINTLILCLSAATLMMAMNAVRTGNRNFAPYLIATPLLGCTFLAIQSINWFQQYHHVSIVARDPDGQTFIYNGTEYNPGQANITLQGNRKELLPNVPFDIHQITPAERSPRSFIVPRETISQIVRYGPAKNIFYAFYFLLTISLCVHLLIAVLIVAAITPQAISGKLPLEILQNMAIYWYYLIAIWLCIAPLLYLV